MIISLVSSVPHFMRNSRALLTIPCLALVLACSVSEPRWQQATNVECLVWNPQPDPGDTVTWTGPCVAGKANGAGTEVFRYLDHGTLKEQRYVGTMTAGKLQGHGTLYFDNGDQFEGEFSNGSRVRGLYTRSNGDRYEGPYKNDKPNGFGTFLFNNGARYVGDFVDGIFQGNGTSTDPAGSRYVGQFHDGLPHGHGTLQLSSGQVFSGQWKDGCLIGGNQVAAVGVTKEKCQLK